MNISQNLQSALQSTVNPFEIHSFESEVAHAALQFIKEEAKNYPQLAEIAKQLYVERDSGHSCDNCGSNYFAPEDNYCHECGNSNESAYYIAQHRWRNINNVSDHENLPEDTEAKRKREEALEEIKRKWQELQ